MRKHIFGFALFSFIVASFVLIYAFFYAPSIPPRESVKPPVAQLETRPEKPYYCRSRSNKLSYEVLSSQFDLETKELTSKVRITWNGSGAPPKQIFARAALFTLDQKSYPQTLETIAFTKVFENRDEATLILISKLDKSDFKIDERQNFYINFNFSDDASVDSSTEVSKNLSGAHQVLKVYGEGRTMKTK